MNLTHVTSWHLLHWKWFSVGKKKKNQKVLAPPFFLATTRTTNLCWCGLQIKRITILFVGVKHKLEMTKHISYSKGSFCLYTSWYGNPLMSKFGRYQNKWSNFLIFWNDRHKFLANWYWLFKQIPALIYLHLYTVVPYL